MKALSREPRKPRKPRKQREPQNAGFALIPALLLAGCAAQPALQVPEIESARIRQGDREFANERVEILVGDRARLLAIEFAIATRAAARCGRLAWPHPGVLLSSATAFDDELVRQEVEARFGAGRDTAIVYLVPGSGLDQAGFRANDEIVQIDDHALDAPDDLTQYLVDYRERSTFEFTVRRGEGELVRQATLDRACPVMASPVLSHMMTTDRRDRLSAVVPLGLVALTPDDDLLASIIAHEMAHSLFDRDGETPLEQEMRADREGLFLAARAGFDVTGLEAYWRQVAHAYPWLIDAKAQIPVNDLKENGRPIDYQMRFRHYEIAARLPEIRRYIDLIQSQLAERSAAEAAAAPIETTAPSEENDR